VSDGRRWTVGIDIGGTYTDLVAVADDGTVQVAKVLSVPGDRSAGVEAALEEAALPAGAIEAVVHGTTVVTNLLLERAGARVVGCATAGFTDLLELRRQERAALYDLTRHHPPPLVPVERMVGVRERCAPDHVLEPLDDDAIADAVAQVVALRPDTVAITLLHAYADPTHERRLAAALRARLAGTVGDGVDGDGDDGATDAHAVDVVCSHDVLPEIREYERTATTVAEAYARPAVRDYLARLSQRLSARGLPAARIMTSTGGTLAAGDASRHAAALALSGPAGGIAGAALVARALGVEQALTIDIGGTSADVGLVLDGEPLVERGGLVAGVPIALPRVLVDAVAAGGGSVGWVDGGGALRAGPESAGAVPGPAAYGRGGTVPTVTDAHVVLGHIAPGAWSGGVTIDADRARAAVATLAARLAVSAERAAAALIATADASMARALRRISVERGIDPRGTTLVAFGGGGPLHACGLAEQLGIRDVIVPPHAGVLSALGLALAPERRDGLHSFVVETASVDGPSFRALLEGEAERLRGGDGASAAALTPRWWVRMRYVGQGHELDVPAAPDDDGRTLHARFEATHAERLGFTLARPSECVSVRTTLTGPARTVALRPATPSASAADGDAIAGPATVRLPDATLRVAPGWIARPLPIGGWRLNPEDAP
jgi:N-methylhydantoinase A